MAGLSVPVKKGISVKNEKEINTMALNMKEILKKNVALTSEMRQQLTATNVYINRNGRSVSIPVAISFSNGLPKRIPEKLKDYSEDVESIAGRFGWQTIGPHYIPYIIRIISSKQLKFVSLRMVETQLLSNYLHYLHANIYTCTSVKRHLIADSEADLLNEINLKHSDQVYGKEKFVSGKDCIIGLKDAHEFYLFIEMCYKRLKGNFTPDLKEKCGFIRINSESVVPYCIKDDKKYVPLFYFEGGTDELKNQAIKLENWNLAYLKFCCKVQGIQNELFDSDSCLVTSFDDIKSCFPPDTNFEDYWPAKVISKDLVTNQMSSHINSPGWIKSPSTLGLKAANVKHPPLSQTDVPPPSTSMGINSYQNGWPSNQLDSAMLQQTNSNNNPINIHPPSLDESGSIATTQIINNNAPYPNVNKASIYHSMTTICEDYSMTNSNVMLQSHQLTMEQGSQRPSSGGGQFRQKKQQQQTYRKPIMNEGSVVSSNPRIGNTKQRRNALRTTAPVSELIDLSSPPSSPEPFAGLSPPPSDKVTNAAVSWKLQSLPECPQKPIAYKIQKASLKGKIIHCINAKAFNYSDLLVTLNDLVETMFPAVTVERCAQVLTEYLNVTLYRGNSDQLTVLRVNHRIRSMYPDDTPMAMLKDITHIFPVLKGLVRKRDEQTEQFSVGTPAKRPRKKRT